MKPSYIHRNKRDSSYAETKTAKMLSQVWNNPFI